MGKPRLEIIGDEESADNRRESAIASSASLRPNFQPKAGLTDTQLSKFQELHKRRLQIKAKSKLNKKTKVDRKGKLHLKADDVPNTAVEDSFSSQISSNDVGDNMPVAKQSVGGSFSGKTRQKLHWGLDTKERWERKANM